MTTAADFVTQIETLERELAEHDAAAREIRETLAMIRKRLAATPGARAGRNARSGRRRKTVDATDLRAGRTMPLVDARGGERVPETVTD